MLEGLEFGAVAVGDKSAVKGAVLQVDDTVFAPEVVVAARDESIARVAFVLEVEGCVAEGENAIGQRSRSGCLEGQADGAFFKGAAIGEVDGAEVAVGGDGHQLVR